MIGRSPTFSPSEFVAVFNQSVEMMYPAVAIVGEIANFRVSKNQWVYFDLKDNDSNVKFFGTVRSLPGPLEDGLSLEVVGQPRLHPKFGFSINILSIEVVGQGSIAKAQSLLAKKLEGEGLFNPERKRLLPYPPEHVGLITSTESAAYADFIKIINHRWGNINIEVADCLVQGASAPEQITNAIDSFNSLPNPPEVLVLIRGGGSADDLAAFSTEQVVRAVATSRIPTLVAIGHEIDVSLAELTADLRASTPSNAAELLVPEKKHERQLLAQKTIYMSQATEQILITEKQFLTEARDSIWQVLNKKTRQELLAFSHSVNLLNALSPNALLKRGYSVVRKSSGELVRSVKSVKQGDKLEVALNDGKINTQVL